MLSNAGDNVTSAREFHDAREGRADAGLGGAGWCIVSAAPAR